MSESAVFAWLLFLVEVEVICVVALIRTVGG